MKIRKALVIYKKSSYETHVLERRDLNYIRLLAEKSAAILRSRIAHDAHIETLDAVQKELNGRGISYEVRHRKELRSLHREYDIIFTIGGDGTFLEAGHYFQSGLIFGINSSPEHSVGHFCKANGVNFGDKLDKLLRGQAKVQKLNRVQAQINNDPPLPYALNDFLFSNTNPAGTTRYILQVDGKKEEQKSSGIWIATSAGSTAAIRSSGGKKMPLSSKNIQFLIREPYETRKAKYTIRRGMLTPREQLKIVTIMDDSALYIDGPHTSFPLRRGDEITVRHTNHPLHAVW